MKAALASDGVVVVNMIAAPSETDAYFRATIATYGSVFGRVLILRAQPQMSLNERQNLILVMGDRQAMDHARHLGYEVVPMPKPGLVLTDDHAPVEQLIQRAAGS